MHGNTSVLNIMSLMLSFVRTTLTTHRKMRARMLILVLGIAVPALLGRTAHAATINVPCTVTDLIDAINTANAQPGADTLVLTAACTYSLTAVNNFGVDGPNGLPIIFSDITIQGNGAIIERAVGAPRFRFFEAPPGSRLVLDNVTIRNGLTRDGAGGRQNSDEGGAILNGGILVITNSTLTNNATGRGRDASNSGRGGHGGALFNADGTVTIRSTSFTGNQAGRGGDSGTANGGEAGEGGAIYNFSGSVDIRLATFSGNSTGRGGNGACCGGNGGRGGALFNRDGATLTIDRTTISQNQTGAGGTGAGSQGGIGGHGGGIHNRGNLTMTASVIDNNTTGNGGAGVSANVFGGDAGDGGGLRVADGGVTTITNSTFAANTTGQGGNGNTATGGNGGAGGGISQIGNSTLVLRHVTIAGNSTGARGAGAPNGNRGAGGGLHTSSNISVAVTGSIIANNVAGAGDNCRAVGGTVITDQGANLQFPGTSCPPSITSTDPLLAPAGLAPNGGPTRTIALQALSPAINQGNATVCTNFLTLIDQRGFLRPAGPACDIGAFEFGAAAPPAAGSLILTGPTTTVTIPLTATLLFPFVAINNGVTDATNTILTATLPTGSRYVSATFSIGGVPVAENTTTGPTCVPSTGTQLVCRLGTLTPGQVMAVDVRVQRISTPPFTRLCAPGLLQAGALPQPLGDTETVCARPAP